MKTGYIKLSETNTIEVRLIDSTVWMTANEISYLFGVYVPMVNNQLRRIFKDNLLRESEVAKEYRYTCLKYGECIRVYYNLDVIIFISFSIETLYTNLFREWIFRTIHGQERNDKIHNTLIMCHLEASEYSQLSLN